MNRYVRPADSLPVSRRSMIMNAGLAAAALAGLSSCTNYGADQAPTGGGSSAGAGSTPITAKTSDIPVGGGKIFAAKAVVVTQPSKGTFKAFSTVCTHQGCSVNAIKDGTINCPCHGSKFAIGDGSVSDGPAPKPLPAKQISVEGDSIILG